FEYQAYSDLNANNINKFFGGHFRGHFRLISVHIPAYLSIRYLEQKIRKRLINFNEIGIFPPPFGEKPV
ncbi:MAG: hypothetical protein CMO53_04145, partial [Verrucomicrobiales bacterium]|nr:hypothetical protein [Verrucomicrobiales bacterium]